MNDSGREAKLAALRADGERLAAAQAGARQVTMRFADAVRETFGPRLRRIRLFGSLARGDWLEESDVDVLVLLDTATDEDRGKTGRLASKIGLIDNDVLIVPVTLSTEAFQEMRDRERRFALDIDREGIDL